MRACETSMCSKTAADYAPLSSDLWLLARWATGTARRNNGVRPARAVEGLSSPCTARSFSAASA